MSDGSPVRVGDTVAGKYRVESVLGTGGMGVVVAARHVELGELFAIKMMLPAALGSADAVARFLREARAAARLKGEHVARVHDVGRLENGVPYMVMEHLVGTDLKQVVEDRGPLPPGEVVGHLRQVCEAIAEAHALGIIHRDLKPANLFLTTRPNGTACVKVLDFGISKQGPGDGIPIDVTRTTAIFGSPLYMSPEQMRATRTVDARTDIWALGVILYELLAGEVPFAGEALTEICAKVFQDAPVPLLERRDGVSRELDGLVMRCLEKEPARRFQSVAELGLALAALDGSVSAPALRGPAQPGASSAGLSGSDVPAPRHSAPPQLLPSASTAASGGTPGEGTRAQPSMLLKVGGVFALALAALIAAVFVVRGVVSTPSDAPAQGSSPSAEAPPTPPETSSEPTVSPALPDSPASSASSSAPAASADRPAEAEAPPRTSKAPGRPGRPHGPAPTPSATAAAGAATTKPASSPAVPAVPPPTASGTTPAPRKHEGVL